MEKKIKKYKVIYWDEIIEYNYDSYWTWIIIDCWDEIDILKNLNDKENND